MAGLITGGNKLSIVIYPGSFDPMTLGHVDLIERLSPHYDEIVTLVVQNTKKTPLFSVDERVQLAQRSLSRIENVRVDSFNGLTITYAQKIKSRLIIRGVRAIADFEYEMSIAHMNKKLCSEIETLLILANPDLAHLSSRIVKEVAYFQGSLKGIVPAEVESALIEKIKHYRNSN